MDNIEVTPAGAKVYGYHDDHHGRRDHHDDDEARRVRDSWMTDGNDASRILQQTHWDGETTRDIIKELSGGFSAALLQTEKNNQEVERAVTASAQETRNLLLNGFNQGRTDLFQGFAAAATERVKFAGEAALTACVNTAAIQAAIAACCCEQKELTRAEANATRDLVNSVQKDNIQSQLTAALNQINLLKLESQLGKTPK